MARSMPQDATHFVTDRKADKTTISLMVLIVVRSAKRIRRHLNVGMGPETRDELPNAAFGIILEILKNFL